MYCKKCGCLLRDDAKFCEFCGTKVDEDTEKKEELKEDINDDPFKNDNPFNDEPVFEVKEEKKQAKCWGIFAKVGKIIGIVTISCCWIPMVAFVSGTYGIVFSILGMRCYDEESKKGAKNGLILSIIGAAISFVVYIIIILFAAVGASSYYYY